MKPLSRRTVLRGAVGGAVVSLALPPLEAMLGSRGAHADGTLPGPIFGLFFWANGMPWHAGHGGEQAGYADLWTPARPARATRRASCSRPSRATRPP